MSFLNWAMLAGLAAVAIPPIIHLLNRRRYEVVDWGAMQFLQVSEVTRRRLMLEELLLMALRMGLIAVLVLALARPFSDKMVLSVGDRPNRDVVLIFDGSASMSFQAAGQSAHEKAKEWATKFVGGLTPGDNVAIVVARRQPLDVQGKLTADLNRVRDLIQRLPEPGGTCDWPAALQAAYNVLDDSTRSERDVILIGDGQRFTWADERTLLGWEDISTKRHKTAEIKPKLWAVNLDPQRPEKPANWSLAPLTSSRAVVAVNQPVLLRSAIIVGGSLKKGTGPLEDKGPVPFLSEKYDPPHALRLEVDGKFVARIEPPKPGDLEKGQVPFSLEHRFTKPGSHLLSVIVEPDPPAGQRPPGYVVKDYLPADNRRDLAVEVVPALPVLLVDGDDKEDPKPRGSDFLRDALAPARDQTPVIKARVVPVKDFQPAHLRGDPKDDKKPSEDRPRVLILCNVPTLSREQNDAVEQFLQDGGGVLVTAGDRVDPIAYNRQLHREGRGWLPAQLDKVQGDESDLKTAVRPSATTFNHPALEMFRQTPVSGLDAAWFSRWWKVTLPERASSGLPIAEFTRDNAPFLLERTYAEGRVILSTVPLDTSWRTNVTDLPAFVPLAHELVYYLAGTRSGEYNLEPGQPLRYRLPSEVSVDGLTLQGPLDPEPKPLKLDAEDDGKVYPAQIVTQPSGNVVVHEGMRESGVWRLAGKDRPPVYYVVQSDAREADLAPATDEDRKSVEKFLPFAYENEAEKVLLGLSRKSQRQEFWWWFLLAVIGFLCLEVWFTRKIVMSRV